MNYYYYYQYIQSIHTMIQQQQQTEKISIYPSYQKICNIRFPYAFFHIRLIQGRDSQLSGLEPRNKVSTERV